MINPNFPINLKVGSPGDIVTLVLSIYFLCGFPLFEKLFLLGFMSQLLKYAQQFGSKQQQLIYLFANALPLFVLSLMGVSVNNCGFPIIFCVTTDSLKLLGLGIFLLKQQKRLQQPTSYIVARNFIIYFLGLLLGFVCLSSDTYVATIFFLILTFFYVVMVLLNEKLVNCFLKYTNSTSAKLNYNQSLPSMDFDHSSEAEEDLEDFQKLIERMQPADPSVNRNFAKLFFKIRNSIRQSERIETEERDSEFKKLIQAFQDETVQQPKQLPADKVEPGSQQIEMGLEEDGIKEDLQSVHDLREGEPRSSQKELSWYQYPYYPFVLMFQNMSFFSNFSKLVKCIVVIFYFLTVVLFAVSLSSVEAVRSFSGDFLALLIALPVAGNYSALIQTCYDYQEYDALNTILEQGIVKVFFSLGLPLFINAMNGQLLTLNKAMSVNIYLLFLMVARLVEMGVLQRQNWQVNRRAGVVLVLSEGVCLLAGLIFSLLNIKIISF